ncbi:hypothetical protein EMPS_02931 [Entomortierella parvispora]|uniref:HMG box domain-containing protein n=1 Tax=Entomortierella parvispora TaxID=205924 RepID=A0A9P3LU45_9FUNG|nr:hypothetical protein EMPS_02931 [Entomortierella parvispora]
MLTLSAGGSENLQGLERTEADRLPVNRHYSFQGGSNDHQFLVRPIPHRLSAPALTQVPNYIQQPQQPQQPLYPENSQNIHYEAPSCQQPELPQSTSCNCVYSPFSVLDGTVAHGDMIQGMHVAFEQSEGQSFTAYRPVSALAAFPTEPAVASPAVDYTSFHHDIQPGIIVDEDSPSYPRKRRSPSSQPISLPSRRSSSVSPLPTSLIESTGMLPGLAHSESTTSTVASARDFFSPLSLGRMSGISSFPSKTPLSLMQPLQQWQQIQQMPRAVSLTPTGVSRANGSQRGLVRMHSSPDLQLQHHRPMGTFSHSLCTYLDSAHQSSSSTASTITFLSAPVSLPSYTISHAKVFPASFPVISLPHQVPELGSELQRDPLLPASQLPSQSPSGSSARSMAAGRGADKRHLKSSGSKSDGDTDPSIPLLARKKQKQKQPLPLLARMKKPCNSYMWYRKETYKKNQSEFNAKKFPGSAISKEIARAWKREPESVKRVFEAKAEMEKYRIMQALPSYEFKSLQAGCKSSRPRKKATAGLPLIMDMPMTLPDASSTSTVCEDVVNGPDSIATCSSGDRQKKAGQPDIYIIDDDRTESNENGSGGSNNQIAADQGAANTATRSRVINVDHPPERQESQPQQGNTAMTTFLSPPIVSTVHQQQRHQQLAQFQVQHQQQLQLQNGYPGYRLYALEGPDHNHDKGNVRNEPVGNDNQGSSPSSATDPAGRRKRKN